MSGDPYRKAQPGERLRIPAVAWNRVLDVVGPSSAATPGAEFAYRKTNFQVYCQNETGGDVDRWDVLAITGVTPAPSGPTDASTNQFQTSPAVIGVSTTGTTNGQFVVAVEPIADGKMGLVAIDGVVQVKLDIVDANHRFATPKAYSTELKTASAGEATILWKESGTGTGKWGLVRIGGGAGGGMKIGKITGTWTKNGTATIYEYLASGDPVTGSPTFTGVNRFVTVAASGSSAKWVACGLIDNAWHLIAAECG